MDKLSLTKELGRLGIRVKNNKIRKKDALSFLANVTSKLTPLKKINKTEWITTGKVFFAALEKLGMDENVLVDEDKSEGILNYKGVKIKFRIGGENIYFDTPTFYFKDNIEEGTAVVKKLCDTVYDIGGCSNASVGIKGS